MFDSLSDKLERAFKVLKGQGQITEINVAETLKEVRRALLDADVSFKVAKEFTDRVKEKALGQNVLTSISPNQYFVDQNMINAIHVRSLWRLLSFSTFASYWG